MVANKVCEFLNIPMHENMLQATILGQPVKGNSSVSKDEDLRGTFYTSDKKIDEDLVPERAAIVWEAVTQLMYEV